MTRALPWLLWILWLAGCGWVLLFRTQVTTDLTFFLPRDAGLVDTVLVQQLRSGPASRLLFLALDGADPERLARASENLAQLLRDDPRFEAVDNGSDPALLQVLEQRLFPYRYALTPDLSAAAFTPAGLRRALEARLAELASPLAVVDKSLLPRDPTGAWREVLGRWLAAGGPARRQGVWFSLDGRRALLLARTRASGFDIDAQREALEAVRAGFARVRESPGLSLILSGPGLLSVEANDRITRDAGRLSLLNSLLVTALLLAVYRSFRVLGLSLVPLVSGLVSGAAVTSVVFGPIHGVTLGFGATLLGVAADYPNHFFTHLSGREAPVATMRRIWPTLRLGVLANVAGFAAMLFSGFSGLAQLAVFAGAGLLGAALSCRWVVPVLAHHHVPLPAWVEQGSSLTRLPLWLARLRLLPALLTVGLAGTALVGGTGIWNDDIDALNPVPAERKRLDEALRLDLGAPDLRELVLVLAQDPETALCTSEELKPALDALVATGALGRYDMAARYLPSVHAQAARLAQLPDRPRLQAALDQALRGLPFKPGSFDPFLQEVAAAPTRPPLTLEDLRGTPLEPRVASLLLSVPEAAPGSRGWSREAGTPGAGGRRWAALIPLVQLRDEAALRRALAPWRERGVYYADLRVETSALVRDYRREALRLLGASLVLIAALLAVGLRSIPAAARVLAPMLAAALCTALIMARVSGGLNLYHLVSLLLVMGLSLDQALFFNRDAADPEDRQRTLLSLLVCSSSSMLAFGILALSEVNVLRDIGATVGLGALFAVSFAAMLARSVSLPR